MATIHNLTIDQGSDFETQVTINAGTATTLLSGAHANNATTITVNSTTPFPDNGTITVGSEQITYPAKTGTTFTGATRGANGTTAQALSDTAAVSLVTGALNLTGYTAAAQLRKSHGSTTATAFTATLASATDGIVQLDLTATVTAALAYGRYVWDLQLTTGSGTKMKVVEGIATIRPSVTR